MSGPGRPRDDAQHGDAPRREAPAGAGRGIGELPDAGWLDEPVEALPRVVPSGPGPSGEPDLATDYLGLRLRNPVVASPSPLTGELDTLEELVAAGVGAVVLPSLFEEQLEHEEQELDDYFAMSADVNPEATYGYTPVLDGYNRGATRYLGLLREARLRLDVPVIASLNGVTRGGWTEYARQLVDAGADAVELNVYQVAAGAEPAGQQVEERTLGLVADVVAVCEVPVAVKLSPHWSALGHFARRLVDAGADGLVLFNRFYQPDIDLESLTVAPRLVLSTSDELRLPLRWMALLHGRLDASLAATTGIHEPDDVVKALLAGADVTMATSALLRHGPQHAARLVDGLRRWMAERGYASVRQLTGSVSQVNVGDPAAYERANYLETITRYSDAFRR